MFETQAQNKRYLGDLVDTLMTEAKDESDMFEDVPVDFRHVKVREKILFPEAWKLTPEKRAKLRAQRETRLLAEEDRIRSGSIVNGARLIEAAHKSAPAEVQRPSPVEVRKMGGKSKVTGKQKRTLR